jgi:CubicO group peptidase (beta-lactamase class C family)
MMAIQFARRVMLAVVVIAPIGSAAFAIVMDPALANTPEGRGSFYWGGAFGTWFWLDPVNDVVVVGMIQNVNGSSPTGGSPQVRPLSRQLVYQALVDRKK